MKLVTHAEIAQRQVGLRNGDTVQTINGKWLESANAALAAFTDLARARPGSSSASSAAASR